MSREANVIDGWRQAQTAGKSLAHGSSPYVFFEGPPTANGKPGIHHVWAAAKAGWKFATGTTSFSDLTVALQGAGKSSTSLLNRFGSDELVS